MYYDKYLKYKQKYLDLKEYSEYIEHHKNQQLGGSYNMMYILNKMKNIVEYIPSESYNPNIDIPIDSELVKTIAIKNDLNIKKTISAEKDYEKKYYHVSNNTFENINNTDKEGNISKTLIYDNPKGIWLSCGLSWQKFIGNEPSRWSLASYIYEIIPNENILKISSVKELKQFIDKYQKDDIKIYDVIDWKQVKKDYDGLIVCPYLGDKIWGEKANDFGIYGDTKKIQEYVDTVIGKKWKKNIYFLAEWYRHWDEGTGVIWRTTGLKEIRLIKKTDTYDKLFK